MNPWSKESFAAPVPLLPQPVNFAINFELILNNLRGVNCKVLMKQNVERLAKNCLGSSIGWNAELIYADGIEFSTSRLILMGRPKKSKRHQAFKNPLNGALSTGNWKCKADSSTLMLKPIPQDQRSQVLSQSCTHRMCGDLYHLMQLWHLSCRKLWLLLINTCYLQDRNGGCVTGIFWKSEIHNISQAKCFIE